MLLNRHRGLAELHHAVALLLVGLFFWVYAQFTILFLSEIVRLTPETVLMPYFVSVVLGLMLAGRGAGARGWRLPEFGAGDALALATRQVGVVALVVFAMMFATQDRSISRLFLGTFLVFTWAGLAVLHVVLPRRLASLVFGRGARVPALVLARSASMPAIERWLAGRRHVGLDVTGFVSWDPLPQGSTPPLRGWLGSAAELGELIPRGRVGQVIFWELPDEAEPVRRAVEVCQAQGARVLLRQSIDERLGHRAVSVEVGGQHYFTLHDEPLEEPLNRALKRLFDLALALPVVVLVLPPLALVVWLVQRRQSPGPLLHVRARAGEQRQSFAMLKFRTMHVAPADERAEVRQATADDARVYPFGRFLRRHSLDEFPQFWNVLIGDMSIVGPRPVMPLLDEEFERRARAYRTRHFVKPGITGLAQSEGFRGEITTPEQLDERVRRDLQYIAEWSIWLDVQITLRTLRQVFAPPKSAY
ncbi:exopolysaccharide biosynthesis polyprenyl glycosylphosphotransferase [Oleiharenicola sp. Vm1]|uniref:exopolysaccharide biosynthesis polyprenyl glycosylphosphotransferase n=1 Tax=Oleiharenicola sp. Vm1 TaxID=3398393 RepID=UPI0039F5FE55